MDLSTRSRWLVGVSALPLVLLGSIALRRQNLPLASDIHRIEPLVEDVIPAATEQMTAIRFTHPSVGPFLIEDCNEIVWYSGFGGELVTVSHEGCAAIGGRYGYVVDRWEVWPDSRGRFPAQSLLKSLRRNIMSDDVDRIVLGLPLNAPDSEVAARISRKEFRSTYSFDWAAYAAQQSRREVVTKGRPATILAADENAEDRARRAAKEVIDIAP